MRMTDIIAKKRDGKTLTTAEIAMLVDGYTNDKIPDYQMAAFLMAVFLNDMTHEETAALTMAMVNSGKKINLSEIPGIKVDKHSTGGVADTTTLILAPLVAACGVPVAKLSGRGLGFTGGTIDKLESIPGFCTTLTDQQFRDNLRKYQVALSGQSSHIAPADGKIYALRDVTATVESIPLIASSIMSKKIAAGADQILLDVKVGSGAFMKDIPTAVRLAEAMVNIGCIVGRQTRALLTSMHEPLGAYIGNSLEVEEAVEVLAGRKKTALREVSIVLGCHMLQMSGREQEWALCRQMLEQCLDDGSALRKFAEWVAAQGGDAGFIDDRSLLPQAACQQAVVSAHSGFVERIDVATLGYAASLAGAGRTYKGQQIDLAAGIVMQCRIGDAIVRNQPLAVIHTNNAAAALDAARLVEQAVVVGPAKPAPPPLVLGIVDQSGYHKI